MEMKYIVMKNDKTGVEEIFIFPKTVNHDVMASNCMRLHDTLGKFVRVDRTVVSAGFINAVGMCHGRSESLDMDGRGRKDSELLGVEA